ncbi:MAG: PAS domain S-box protein [Desulfobacterales bacterium]|nr:PAS domain S-box protein [Desulfobacterales bacterium]
MILSANSENTGISNYAHKRKGIFFRFFILSILMIITIITIFSAVTIPRQRKTIIKNMEAQARSVSTSIAQVCGNAIVIEDYSFIVEHNMEVLNQNPDILYVIVVRRDGFSLVHTADGWEQRDNPENWWSIKDSDTGGGDIIYGDLAEQNVFHYSFSLQYSVIPWGRLHLGLSLEEFNKEIRIMYRIMLLLGFFCLAIGVFVAYFFTISLTRPILSLSQITKRIADGDMSARAEIRTGDELEELAASFNKMTEKLQHTTVSKDFVDSIIENMNETLIVTTPEGRIQMVNRYTLNLLGYSEEELLDKPVSILFEDQESIKEVYDLIPKGSERNIEKNFLSGTGKIIPTLFSASKMEEKNIVSGVVCVALNIEDRKTAEENLKQAYKKLKQTQTQLVQTAKLASIGELAAGVAHELNQPLMVIRLNSQSVTRLINKGKSDPEVLAKPLEAVERNTKRMANIINHLRIFSRQSHAEFMPVDVNTVIENSFLMVGEQLRLKNIEVEKHLFPDIPKINGDINKLEQVFLNCITNARHAIGEMTEGKANNPGRIEIISRISDKRKDCVEILIKDNGTGIPQENIEKIFDPFFTTKEVGKGTGLGLSISYGIIRDHQGEIEVAETSENGTSVRIRLPVIK